MTQTVLYTKVKEGSSARVESTRIRYEARCTFVGTTYSTREYRGHLFTTRIRSYSASMLESPRATRTVLLRSWARAEHNRHRRRPTCKCRAFRLSCRGYYTALQFASFLASWFATGRLDWSTFVPTLVHRAHASMPHAQGNTSAEIQKARVPSAFSRGIFDNAAGSAARCLSRARQGNDLLPGDRLPREARVRGGDPA